MQEASVIALHELKAAPKIRLDPTIDVLETFGHRTAFVAQPTIDRWDGSGREPLDNHEERRHLHTYDSRLAAMIVAREWFWI